MSRQHPLMSLTDDPSHPLAFSSLKNGSTSVGMLASGDFFAVFEQNPVCLLNAMEDMSGHARTNIFFEHPYSLSVFYRKSRNPHGPSKRPIFIATYEFSPMTCRTTGGGLFGALIGDRKRPAEAYLIGNFAGGRFNRGMQAMDPGASAACAVLSELAEEYLGPGLSFEDVGSTSTPWDPRFTE